MTAFSPNRKALLAHNGLENRTAIISCEDSFNNFLTGYQPARWPKHLAAAYEITGGLRTLAAP
jgi:hypothetical protein